MAGKPPGPWRTEPLAPGAEPDDRSVYEREFAPLLRSWIALHAGSVAEFWTTAPSDVAAIIGSGEYDRGSGEVNGPGGRQRRNLRRRMAEWQAGQQPTGAA